MSSDLFRLAPGVDVVGALIDPRLDDLHRAVIALAARDAGPPFARLAAPLADRRLSEDHRFLLYDLLRRPGAVAAWDPDLLDELMAELHAWRYV